MTKNISNPGKFELLLRTLNPEQTHRGLGFGVTLNTVARPYVDKWLPVSFITSHRYPFALGKTAL